MAKASTQIDSCLNCGAPNYHGGKNEGMWSTVDAGKKKCAMVPKPGGEEPLGTFMFNDFKALAILYTSAFMSWSSTGLAQPKIIATLLFNRRT